MLLYGGRDLELPPRPCPACPGLRRLGAGSAALRGGARDCYLLLRVPGTGSDRESSLLLRIVSWEVSLGLGPVHRPELAPICEGGKMIVLWKEQRRLEGEREKGIHRKPLGHRCRRLLESRLGCFLAL